MNKRIKKKKGILQRQEYIKYVKSVMIPGQTLYVDCGFRLRRLTELDTYGYDTLTGVDLYTLSDASNQEENDEAQLYSLGCCSFWNCGIRIVSEEEAQMMLKFYKETKWEFIFPEEWFQCPLTCKVGDWSRPQIKIWKRYIELFKAFILKNCSNDYKDWIIFADTMLEKPYIEAENEVQWEEIEGRH